MFYVCRIVQVRCKFRICGSKFPLISEGVRAVGEDESYRKESRRKSELEGTRVGETRHLHSIR